MAPAKHNVHPASDVGLLRRLGAAAYDWLILAAILSLWTIAWTMAGVHLGERQYPYYAASVYIIVFAYFAWFWCRDGQTVGMAIWKIRLNSVHEARSVDLRLAMTRFATAIISILCFGCGFWWTLMNAKKYAWHDWLSDSYLSRAP